MEESKPSPYLDDLNTIRMIVLIECQPLSNTYHQMKFTLEQYDAISRFIYESFPNGVNKVAKYNQGGDGQHDVQVVHGHHPLDAEIQPYYMPGFPQE